MVDDKRFNVSRRFEKFASDQVALVGLFLIIIVALFSYLYLRQTAYYPILKERFGQFLELLWVLVTGAINWIFYIYREFRKKVLFKESKSSVVANKGPKILLWILDGCNVQAFLDVVANNRNLHTFFNEGFFAQCVTIFPTITPAAHSSLLTGCYPSKTRVPAFDWVEIKTDYEGKQTKEYVRCMPDFKRFFKDVSSSKARKKFFDGLGDAFDLNQVHLNPLVYTVFESLGEDWYTTSVKEWIHRGADNFIGVSINEILNEFQNKNITEKSSMVKLLEALYKETSFEFKGLMWGSDNFQKLADLMVYWKTGTDTKSHEYGPDSHEVREEIDEAIEKLAETVSFYKMHTNQPIYVFITADHSQSKVTRFSNLVYDLKSKLSQKFIVAEREDLADTELINNAEIIITNNDRAAFFYTFGKVKQEAKDTIIGHLKEREEVDLILFKKNGKIVVFQNDGKEDIEPEDIESFFKDKQDEYPNAVERIEGLMNGDKWGDIVTSIKEGYSINPDFKPENEGDEMVHGDHGGLNYTDSVVPLLVWGPNVNHNIKNGNWETYRTIDITPTIVNLFSIEPKKTEGVIIKQLFNS